MKFATSAPTRFTRRAAILASLAVATLSHAAVAQAQENVSVRLNWLAAGYTAPFYVGVEKGFYKEAGLNVEVQEGQGSGPTAAQVAAGRTTFGFVSTDALIRAVSQGAPLKMVASIAKDAGYCVLVMKDSGISKPADLKGKKYASTAQSSIGRLLPAYLQAAGLSPDDVQRLSMDYANLPAGFRSRQFDGMEALTFDEVPKWEAQGVAVDCLRYADVGLSLLGPGIVTSQSMIEKNPKVVQGFVNATLRAYQYSFENPDEAAQIAMKATSSITNKDGAVAQLKAFQAVATQPIGSISAEAVQKTLSVIRERLGLQKDVAGVEVLYTDQFLTKR